MDSHSGILQNAQRLRYEALSNFAADLNKANKLADLAEAFASHVKYIIDFYQFRFSHKYNDNAWCFEVFRGECLVFKPKKDNFARFEEETLTAMLPLSIPGNDLDDHQHLRSTSFNNLKTAAVYALPVHYFEGHSVVASITVKDNIRYIDTDFKFLRAIADLVSNKLLQIELLKRIERNNKDLKAKNTQITRMNRNLEQTVALRTAELTSANDELRTLFYRTSHDFRAPLANIMGLSNLGRLVTQDPEVLDLFNKCEEVVSRLDNMLSKLNGLSSFTHEHEVKPLNFAHLLEELRVKYQDKLNEANGKLVYDINLEKEYLADSHTYYTILDNLLENSLNYHKGTLLVQVYIFTYKNHLVIKFSDNGQGISPRIVNRIFDMYYRGHISSMGSGLGLYVVRKLVRSLAGDIFVQSKVKQHTHFIIKVPFEQPLQ